MKSLITVVECARLLPCRIKYKGALASCTLSRESTPGTGDRDASLRLRELVKGETECQTLDCSDECVH